MTIKNTPALYTFTSHCSHVALLLPTRTLVNNNQHQIIHYHANIGKTAITGLLYYWTTAVTNVLTRSKWQIGLLYFCTPQVSKNKHTCCYFQTPLNLRKILNNFVIWQPCSMYPH